MKEAIEMKQISRKIMIVPASYRERIAQFDKKDALLALTVITAYFLVMAISGMIVTYVSQLQMTFIGGGINLLFVVLVLVLLKIRKQGIESIGFKEGNVKLSLILGGILAAILFFCNCLSNVLFEQQSFISFADILIYLVYFFTVGLSEEVLFRGYLESRLHSLTKSVFLDVLVTGILFVLMHFPFRMIAYDMSFWTILSNAGYMTDLFITHLILSYIRIRTDSLYGAILPHWVSDLAYRIVTHI